MPEMKGRNILAVYKGEDEWIGPGSTHFVRVEESDSKLHYVIKLYILDQSPIPVKVYQSWDGLCKEWEDVSC